MQASKSLPPLGKVADAVRRLTKEVFGGRLGLEYDGERAPLLRGAVSKAD